MMIFFYVIQPKIYYALCTSLFCIKIQDLKHPNFDLFTSVLCMCINAPEPTHTVILHQFNLTEKNNFFCVYKKKHIGPDGTEDKQCRVIYIYIEKKKTLGLCVIYIQHTEDSTQHNIFVVLYIDVCQILRGHKHFFFREFFFLIFSTTLNSGAQVTII